MEDNQAKPGGPCQREVSRQRTFCAIAERVVSPPPPSACEAELVPLLADSFVPPGGLLPDAALEAPLPELPCTVSHLSAECAAVLSGW